MKLPEPRELARACLLALLGMTWLAPSTLAAERLYQWQDARSGHTQLSGRAPGWYRSASGEGPRVLVFSGGRLVDDTALPVSEDLRRLLREEALLAAVPEADQAPSVALEGPDGEEASAAAEASDLTKDDAATVAEALAGGTTGPVDAAEARQRALDVIDRFDRARMAAAKAVLETLLPKEDAAP